ncbi:MAG: transport system permease protein, partial [Proteobacteria bacterium]|nr:transport system permease protein [Pseudomonadota bacterium]
MTAANAHFDAAQGALIASGDWHADAASALPRLEGKVVRILDGAAITQLDTNGAWLLLNAVRPQPSDPMPELRGFQPRHMSLLNLVAQHAATTAAQIEV